jgi:peptidoglycan hydrolase-like protein with peptidoglycan-binding domain
MTGREFDIVPFRFQETSAWGTERRTGQTQCQAGAARLPVHGPWPAATRFDQLRRRSMYRTLNTIEGGGLGVDGTMSAAPRGARDLSETREFETLELESPTSTPILSQGSRGPAVTDLQGRLAAAGFSPGAADGIFGSLTDAAVRSFQRARDLAADGIVGPLTWAALGVVGGSSPPTSPPVRPGTDPTIEALNLAEPARSSAYLIKAKHPWVIFTSGRRDPARQASAMAGNVVSNRKWIGQTYANNPVSRAAQAWVDKHPEARTQQAIAAGLLGVFQGFSPADLGRLSYHLSGLAFDIHPVPSQLAAISSTIRKLPRLKEFLTKEGGLTIWHVGLA